MLPLGAMRRVWCALILVVAVLVSGTAVAERKVHVVAPGHTLGKIAKRYHVGIDDLCKANGISRRDPIKPGQKLVIPSGEADEPAPPPRKEPKAESKKDDDDDDEPETRSLGGGMKVIDVPGVGPAYFYTPTGPGRLSMRPVLVYMHGRGGNPQRDCARWAPVARRVGWLACPSGPIEHGGGRAWNNNWATGQRAAVATVQALRDKYGRRVQLYGNTIIGFSEGAYVAMNVGVREPRTFNRWLILAGNTTYWGGPGLEELAKNRARIRRVYLITGEQDGVVEGTKQLREWLEKHKVPTRASMPADMGHEVQLERKAAMYRAALVWLDRGASGPSKKPVAKRAAKKGRRR